MSMLNYLVNPALTPSSEFSDSIERQALQKAPSPYSFGGGMESDFYDPTEDGEMYGEDELDEDADLMGDDDLDDDEDFGDDDDLEDDDDFGDDEGDDDDDFGDDEDDDDFGDEDDDEDFGLLEKAIQAAVSKSVGPQRMRYAKLSREITNLIDKGKRRDPVTLRKIGKLRAAWAKLQGMRNGTAGLESPQEVLREARPGAPRAASPAPVPTIRKVAPKVMPTLPPLRIPSQPGIPVTNADRIQQEREGRFRLTGPDIIAQMKNYTVEKLLSIASNPNRSPQVRQAARDELAKRRAGRPGPGPRFPRRPVVVVQQPGAPAAPAAPVAPATSSASVVIPAATFGAVPRIVAADNVFDAMGPFKAEAALLGIGVFLLGAYAGPPLLRTLSR